VPPRRSLLNNAGAASGQCEALALFTVARRCRDPKPESEAPSARVAARSLADPASSDRTGRTTCRTMGSGQRGDRSAGCREASVRGAGPMKHARAIPVRLRVQLGSVRGDGLSLAVDDVDRLVHANAVIADTTFKRPVIAWHLASVAPARASADGVSPQTARGLDATRRPRDAVGRTSGGVAALRSSEGGARHVPSRTAPRRERSARV